MKTLVNCFKLCIFDELNTTNEFIEDMNKRCELL